MCGRLEGLLKTIGGREMEMAKSAQIEGKIIKTAWISEDNVELTFTDGSDLTIKLEFYGYGGCRLDNSYYENPVEPIEKPEFELEGL